MSIDAIHWTGPDGGEARLHRTACIGSPGLDPRGAWIPGLLSSGSGLEDGRQVTRMKMWGKKTYTTGASVKRREGNGASGRRVASRESHRVTRIGKKGYRDSQDQRPYVHWGCP